MYRDVFYEAGRNAGVLSCNSFGLVAAEAAYNHGRAWLDAVMTYVQQNYYFMRDYIAEYSPKIKFVEPEGTYLVWVDCGGLGLTPTERKRLLMHEAKVYLDEGILFGAGGANFERFNIACPRHILVEGLQRIKETM